MILFSIHTKYIEQSIPVQFFSLILSVLLIKVAAYHRELTVCVNRWLGRN